MNKSIRLKLSAMMFFQYFIWGSWYVTMGTYLDKTLHFKGIEIGSAYGAPAIGAMISPFFIGMIADRFFATEKILAVLHLAGGLLLFYVSSLTSFDHFFWVLNAYTLCFMPTLALTNSISFHQMNDISKEFPSVKLWTGIGWIVAGLIISKLGLEASAVTFKLAAGASILMAIHCLTLPHTPPKSVGVKVTIGDILGLDALKLLRDSSFAIFVAGSFLICIPLTFYYAFANNFLFEIGMKYTAAKMTLGQVSDIVFLLLMPFFFTRFGVKKMLLFGMLAWVMRYLLFSFGNNDALVWMLYGGIIIHGICYDFFFVTGQIYVDQRAGIKIRGAAQGFIAFITLGAGMWVGAKCAGFAAERYTFVDAAGITRHQWNKIWLWPAISAGVVFVLFALFFKARKEKPLEQINPGKEIFSAP
jgi:nucleoside transporter